MQRKRAGKSRDDAAANAPRGADRARPCPPELMASPTLAVAEEIAQMEPPHQGFAKVQLGRGANRFVAAMRAAQRLVDAA